MDTRTEQMLASTGPNSPVGATEQARGEERATWKALFARLADGDLSALEEIYDLGANDLFGLALWRTSSRSDADDLVQETFVRLAKLGERVRSISNPRAYALQITHRLAIDLQRSRRRLPESEPVDDQLIEAPPAASPEQRLAARNVNQAVRELPAKQRDAVYLHHFVGLTFAEIGKVTGVPTFTAASRVRLGFAKLRKMMGVRS